jgi:hypothetical protein
MKSAEAFLFVAHEYAIGMQHRCVHLTLWLTEIIVKETTFLKNCMV